MPADPADQLHDLAVAAGAMVLGDPPQYLFTLGQLMDFADAVDGTAALVRLQERCRAAANRSGRA